MKKIIGGFINMAILFAASLQTHAQGFIYDQQSATNGVSLYADNVDGLDIQPQPLTQSFTPSLSAIGFVQYQFWDVPLINNGNSGATVYVKLWTGSPNLSFATLLGSTAPVYMPDGFGNLYPGVTNFNFSTPITLTPGQTYYLQPVVQSGDNPWDIITIGDTYPNGQLFVRGAGFNTDMWFREGVTSVPEPTILDLIGLGSLLVFGFKRRSKLIVQLLFSVSVLSVHAAGDSVVQVTADQAGLPAVSASALPRAGTYWVMMSGANGNLTALPYPGLPPDLSALPIYSVADNIFMVDDTGGQLAPSSARGMGSAMTASVLASQAGTVMNLISQVQDSELDSLIPGNGGTNNYFISDYTPPNYGTNLWLENLHYDPTNAWLRLHNTVSGDNYQLLSAANLSGALWVPGEILLEAAAGQSDFSPVPRINAMTFFRVHHANPVMEIWNSQDSEELNPTNTGNPGHAGVIYLSNEGWQTNGVTVYYSIGGTARNGIDYSNLTGVAVISANSYYAEIDINPTADGLNV